MKGFLVISSSVLLVAGAFLISTPSSSPAVHSVSGRPSINFLNLTYSTETLGPSRGPRFHVLWRLRNCPDFDCLDGSVTPRARLYIHAHHHRYRVPSSPLFKPRATGFGVPAWQKTWSALLEPNRYPCFTVSGSRERKVYRAYTLVLRGPHVHKVSRSVRTLFFCTRWLSH
jgi:hypothetical protein